MLRWTQSLRSGDAELALRGIIFFVSKRKPRPPSRIFQATLCPSKDKFGIGTNLSDSFFFFTSVTDTLVKLVTLTGKSANKWEEEAV